jgi:hypothetical protein
MKTKILLVTAVACFYFATASLAQTIPAYVPTNGLVGWWPFNGNANDESGNGNHGTINGATISTDRFGNPNKSFEFSLPNSRIIVNNSFLNNGLNDYSISVWFNPTNNLVNGCLINSIPHDGFGITYSFYGTNKKIYHYKNSDPANTNHLWDILDASAFNYPQFDFNNWYNVTIVKSGHSYNYYVNGILDRTINITQTALQYNCGLIFGNIDPNIGSEPFNGKLDDIGIWNRALTQQEITALYQSNNCSVPAYVPTNGLVGYWPFCGNANDVSGNGNNGTVNGASLTNDRFGNANQAYSFDGVNDYVISPGGTNYINDSLTISFWIYNTTNAFSNAELICIGSPSSTFYGVVCSNLGTRLNYGRGCGETAVTNANTPFSLNTWNHIVVKSYAAPNQTEVYLNGNLQGYATNSNPSGCSSSNLYFGVDIFSISEYYFGLLDDIGIWNRALTQQEITQLYTSGCTKPEPVSLGTSASTMLCPSESVTIKIGTPADSANYTYQWTRNGTNMVGATTRSITVNDAAKYKVFVSSGPGVDCRRVSGLVETTPSTPPAITATAPNGTSYCPGDSVLMTATGATAGYSYRWKRFGVVIPGADSNTFYATQTGNYRCEIFNAGGCITQSNLISITNGTSCRIMEQTNSDVSVYPNPAQNAFTVSFNDIGNETPVSVSLRSMQGQVIEQRNIAGKEDVQFTVNKLSPGLYVVIIQLESGDSIEKTVVVE